MEFPVLTKNWKKGMKSLDIVYPNLYFGGVYCLGPLIAYNIANQKEDWACRRVFLDQGKITAPFVGFSLQWELDYYHVLEMLQKAGIPFSKKRKQVIFAGGPVITANPEAFSALFDFMVLGELEECLPKILELYDQDKETFLQNIEKIEGVFIPGKRKSFSFVKDLDAVPYPLYQPLPVNLGKEFVFGKTFILETERGCSFRCDFCSIPGYYNGLKFRSLKKIQEIVEEGLGLNQRKKVSLYAPAFIHPKRKEILGFLVDRNVDFTLPSIRLEAIDDELLGMVTKAGVKSLTIAPESTERLRLSINKRFSDEQLFQCIQSANKAKLENLKLYFMFGLAEEKEEDLRELVSLTKKLKEQFKGKLYLSLNPYVSKKDTKLQVPFDASSLKKKKRFLEKELRDVRHKFTSIPTSRKEWEIANATLLLPEQSQAAVSP